MKERPRVRGAAVEEVVEFLKKVPPFQFLEDQPLREVARVVALEYYPTGALILEQDGPPSENLLVIKKGGAKVFIRSEENEETLVDYRGRGRHHRLRLALHGRPLAHERRRHLRHDLLPHRQGRTSAASSTPTPRSASTCTATFLSKYLDKTLHEMRTRSILVGGGERLLFTTPVGELATGTVVTAPPGLSIQAAAGDHVAQPDQLARSCSTRRARPRGSSPTATSATRSSPPAATSPSRPTEIMSSPLVTVDARDYCFEALLTMIRNNIHHLLVVESGAVEGDHHQPRPDDPAGDLAALGRPGDRAAAGRRRAWPSPRAR